MQKLNKVLLVLIILLPGISFSQQFSHSAKLEGITASRFYSLAIEPELSAYIHASFKDLRIVDDKGVQVPYVLNSSLPNLVNQNFLPLAIKEYSVKDSGRSHLVLENTTKHTIDGLAFFIRNASVSRTAKVSGSDDGQSWFTILENLSFTGGQFSDSSHFVLTMALPKSSYRYFKIVVDNLNNDPLNIIKAVTYSAADYTKWLISSSTVNLRSFVNPASRFIQTDSIDGNTYIRVIQPEAYHVDAIMLRIKSPRFFRRNMEVIIGNVSHGFLLTSTGEYSLPRFAAKEFMIKISNGDNPPLTITEVITSQEKKELIAYLEAGKHYRLLMGNPSAETPTYDLEHFMDSISDVRSIGVADIQANIQSIANKEQKSNLTLWIIIAGVLGVLSFFTWNLTKELKKRNQ
jgi:hypothetical protein